MGGRTTDGDAKPSEGKTQGHELHSTVHPSLLPCFSSLLRPVEVDAHVQQQERPHHRVNDPLQVRRLRDVTTVDPLIVRFFPAFFRERRQQANHAGGRRGGPDYSKATGDRVYI